MSEESGTWVSCEVAPEVEGAYKVREKNTLESEAHAFKNGLWSCDFDHADFDWFGNRRLAFKEWFRPDWIAVRDGKRPAGLADGARFQFRTKDGFESKGRYTLEELDYFWRRVSHIRLAPEKVNAAERANGGGYFLTTASQEAPGHERLPVPAVPKHCGKDCLIAGKCLKRIDCALPVEDQRGTAAKSDVAADEMPSSRAAKLGNDRSQRVPHLTRRERQAAHCTCDTWLDGGTTQHFEYCALMEPPYITRAERQAATQAEIVALRRDVKRVIGKHNPSRKFGSRDEIS